MRFWGWGIVGMVLLSSVACHAGSRTVALSADQETAVSALASAQKVPVETVMLAVVHQGILVEQQRQRQVDEAALLDAFRKLSTTEQETVLTSGPLKKKP